MTPPKEHDDPATLAAARHIADATGTQPSPGLLKKMLEAQRREKDVLLAEMVKVKGLMPLLMKHRNGAKWSDQERAELQEQLRSLAHISPYMVVLVMPGSFVVLPVLAWWLDRRRISARSQPPADKPTGGGANP